MDDDPGCGGRQPCYATIQSAADAAVDGDVVRVAPGRYAEQVVLADKGLVFEGPGMADAGKPSDPLAQAVWSGLVGGRRGPALVVDARTHDVRAVRVQGFRVVSATHGVLLLGRRAGDPVPPLGGLPPTTIERTDVIAGEVRDNVFQDVLSPTGELRGAVVAVWARDLVVSGNWVHGADVGLAAWASSRVRLTGNTLTDISAAGVLVQAHGDDVVVADNTIAGSLGRGIEVHDLVRTGVDGICTGLTLRGNQVTAPAGEGIAILADGGGRLAGVRLAGNRIADAGGQGAATPPGFLGGLVVRGRPGQVLDVHSDGDVVRRTRQPDRADTAGIYLERITATAAISQALVSDGEGVGLLLLDVAGARLTGSVVTRNRVAVAVIESIEQPEAVPGAAAIVLGGAPNLANHLGGNTTAALVLSRGGDAGTTRDVDARHNDWGTAYAPEIEARVRHRFDDVALGRVTYLPALGAPERVTLAVEPPRLVADGQSAARVSATVADAAGLPVADDTLVAVATDLGTVAGGGAEAQAERGDVRRLGTWQQEDSQDFGPYGGAGYLRSRDPGARLVWTFDAPAVAMAYGQAMSGAGLVRLQVDGRDHGLLSTSGPDRLWTWRLLARDLGPGPHTVTVTLQAGDLSVDALAAGNLTTNGVTSLALRAGQDVGVARVRALAYGAGGSRTANLAVPFTAGPAATLRLRLDRPVLPVGGATGALTAEAWDERGRPVPDGTVVRFTTTAGTIDPVVANTRDGRALAILTSGAILGAATVRAESGTAVDTTTVTFVPGPPAAVEVAGSRGSLAANSVASLDVLATVRDAWGHPVTDGTPVTFTASMGTLEPDRAATAGGVARSRLQAGRSAGTAVIRAGTRTAAGSLTIPFVATDLRLRKTVEPQSNVVPGETVTFTLSVANVGGGSVYDTVITDVIPAGLITRTVTALGLPNLIQIAGPAFRWRLPSLRPGERGAITMTLTVDPAHSWGKRTEVVNTATAASATAAERNPDDNATRATLVVVPFAAYTVTLTAPASLMVGGTTGPVQARVVDKDGRQAPDGTLVYFATDLGAITPEMAPTRGGVARVTFVTGTRAGTASIRAETQEERGATALVKVLPAPPQKLELVSARPWLQVGGGTTVVTATLADAYANPVAGEAVVFTTSLGAFDTPGGLRGAYRGNTSSTGLVTTTLVSGARTGVATVGAQNGMLQRRLEIPFRPGPPHFLSLRLARDQIVVGDTVEVVGRVADAYDNPLPGIPLAFSTQVGQLTSPAGLSDAAGEVRTAVLGDTPGFGPVSVTGAGRTAFSLLTVRAIELFLPYTARPRH